MLQRVVEASVRATSVSDRGRGADTANQTNMGPPLSGTPDGKPPSSTPVSSLQFSVAFHTKTTGLAELILRIVGFGHSIVLE